MTSVGSQTEPTPHASRMEYPPAKRKLTGRAFYESLGSPKLILAPMVDQSEFAWRMLTRSFMTPETNKDLLAYTPMLHARMFSEAATFRNHHFQPLRSGLDSLPERDRIDQRDIYLDGNPSIDRPLFVQFCANSPEEYLRAAEYVQPFCDAVDLNLGCPQGIAKKGNYGAFLQEDWDLIYRLINTLHQKLDIPITAKIRILETKEKTLEYAKAVLSAGASIITVHGRQREQKGHKTGLADWSVLRYLREHLPVDTVIFANGNILRHQDISKCLEETGADGVMSAEGNLHDPTIFAKPPAKGDEGREYWRGRDGKGGYRVDAVFRRYMDSLHQHVLETPPPERKPLFLPSDQVEDSITDSKAERARDTADGEPPAKQRKRDKNTKRCTSPNLVAMQPHLFHLLRPLVSKHTDVRDALARCRAGDIAAYENVLSMVEDVVKDGLLDYDFDPTKYEESIQPDLLTDDQKVEQAGKDETSLAMVKDCQRPWWVCQPYVRPLPKEALQKGSLTMSKKDMKKLEAIDSPESTVGRLHTESSREKIDQADGMPQSEMPKESMQNPISMYNFLILGPPLNINSPAYMLNPSTAPAKQTSRHPRKIFEIVLGKDRLGLKSPRSCLASAAHDTPRPQEQYEAHDHRTHLVRVNIVSFVIEVSLVHLPIPTNHEAKIPKSNYPQQRKHTASLPPPANLYHRLKTSSQLRIQIDHIRTLEPTLIKPPKSNTTLVLPLEIITNARMHPLTSLAALLAFTSTALALPAVETLDDPFTGTAPLNEIFNGTSTLEPRANWGWVGDYADVDPQCNGKWHVRPKMNHRGGCKLFSPAQGIVGISHGVWPNNFANLCVYSDSNCKNSVGTVEPPSNGGSWQCVAVKDYGGTWNSMKAC